jgi:hypothetical protein
MCSVQPCSSWEKRNVMFFQELIRACFPSCQNTVPYNMYSPYPVVHILCKRFLIIHAWNILSTIIVRASAPLMILRLCICTFKLMIVNRTKIVITHPHCYWYTFNLWVLNAVFARIFIYFPSPYFDMETYLFSNTMFGYKYSKIIPFIFTCYNIF